MSYRRSGARSLGTLWENPRNNLKLFPTSADGWVGLAMDAKRVLWVNAGFASEAGRLPVSWQTAYLEPAEALKELKNNEFQAVVLEFPMPHWTPGELLLEVQRLAPGTPVLLRDPEATVSDAVRL